MVTKPLPDSKVVMRALQQMANIVPLIELKRKQERLQYGHSHR